jgi:hypothetical protein
MAMFRYAFGRMTYMPSTVIEIIKANADTLTAQTLGLLDRDLTDEAKEIVLTALDRKYFSPEITKILSVKERFGYSYWSVETDHGKMDFTLQDTFRSIAKISDTRIVITDIKGNRFNITDVEALDHSSFRKIELYL